MWVSALLADWATSSAACSVWRYALRLSMIISFKHRGLETYYRTDSVRGIDPAHRDKLSRILGALDAAAAVDELNLPSFKLHPLKGKQKGFWSIWVNGNWRVTFRFVGIDVELVDYLDYH